ncbi:hypothetical protein [Paraglaciecola sp. 25GB23A]|uniref:hypothetical protein n=1 Tax=Paraglaciecola sp. 25GB23A TaxID=3156068 RepID=UPI0032AEEA4B
MNLKLVALLIFLFINNPVTAEDVTSYEKEFYLFVETAPEIFQSSVNLYEEIHELNVESNLKSKLLDCALNERHIYLKEYIPFFKKYLSIEDMQGISTWLKTASGQLWVDFHKGKIETSSLSEKQVTEINKFTENDSMKKLELATEESLSVAHVAGKKFADYCSEKVGL